MAVPPGLITLFVVPLLLLIFLSSVVWTLVLIFLIIHCSLQVDFSVTPPSSAPTQSTETRIAWHAADSDLLPLVFLIRLKSPPDCDISMK